MALAPAGLFSVWLLSERLERVVGGLGLTLALLSLGVVWVRGTPAQRALGLGVSLLTATLLFMALAVTAPEIAWWLETMVMGALLLAAAGSFLAEFSRWPRLLPLLTLLMLGPELVAGRDAPLALAVAGSLLAVWAWGFADHRPQALQVLATLSLMVALFQGAMIRHPTPGCFFELSDPIIELNQQELRRHALFERGFVTASGLSLLALLFRCPSNAIETRTMHLVRGMVVLAVGATWFGLQSWFALKAAREIQGPNTAWSRVVPAIDAPLRTVPDAQGWPTVFVSKSYSVSRHSWTKPRRSADAHEAARTAAHLARQRHSGVNLMVAAERPMKQVVTLLDELQLEGIERVSLSYASPLPTSLAWTLRASTPALWEIPVYLPPAALDCDKPRRHAGSIEPGRYDSSHALRRQLLPAPSSLLPVEVDAGMTYRELLERLLTGLDEQPEGYVLELTNHWRCKPSDDELLGFDEFDDVR